MVQLKQFRDDYSLFEYCLARLEAGEDLESILASIPDEADKMRPVLQAADQARHTGEPVRIPASAKIDSRTRFLVEASRMQKKSPGFQPHFRLAGAIAIAVFILFAGLFGTGLASAETVPGETLYPIKRAMESAQLALTSDQSTRLDLEEEFDRRRVTETEKLVEAGRTESVSLAGTLNETTEHVWVVGNVPLALTPDQLEIAHSLRGSYVEVKGKLQTGNGLSVETMELRLFNISGLLDSMTDKEWVVSGVKILVMENTQITGKPEVGRKVYLSALHYDEDYFLALSAQFTGPSSQKNNGQEQHNNNGKDNQGNDDDQGTLEPSETIESDKHDSNGGSQLVTLTVEPTDTPDHEEDGDD